MQNQTFGENVCLKFWLSSFVTNLYEFIMKIYKFMMLAWENKKEKKVYPSVKSLVGSTVFENW